MKLSAKVKVVPASGWVLICRDEDSKPGEWHVAWCDVFSRKHEALRFAQQNNWPKPYRAVRGEIRATKTAGRRAPEGGRDSNG